MLPTRFITLSASIISVGSLAFAQSPPVANTGGNSGDDYVVDCNNVFSPGSAVTAVQLDGSTSFDPDGTPVSFLWYEECPFGNFPDPTSPTPIYNIDMTGVCQRTCVVALRVFSGGEMTVNQFTVTVQDVSAPTISCPPDVVGIWGDDTTPGATGTATATDNCDPAPVVGFSDVITPQGGPGTPEQIITRTWTATDCVGLQANCVQVITLLSPSGGPLQAANMDFDPANCPNAFAPTGTGTVDVLLLGAPSFPTKNVVNSTVRLWVRSNPGVSIKPSGFSSKDLGSITATQYGDCNSSILDGQKDLRLRFSRAALISQLGLSSYAPGQTVEVAISGKTKAGKLFAVRDVIVIQ